MSEKELQWLYECSLKMNSIIEIGSWKGRSTYALCCGCKGEVYAVDHFEGSREHQIMMRVGKHLCDDDPYGEFCRTMDVFDNISLYKGSSEDAAKSLLIPEKVDMVFIDGDHTYEGAISDLRLWASRANKLLCGHDFNELGVRDALVDYFPGRKIVSVDDTWMWTL